MPPPQDSQVILVWVGTERRGRAEIPRVPWSAMVGMRNRLVHAYFDVDHDILWTTVTISLPCLVQSLHPALDDG
ncbi:MAG: DUF86 domain-containing protein [Burkholderiales bacterium]